MHHIIDLRILITLITMAALATGCGGDKEDGEDGDEAGLTHPTAAALADGMWDASAALSPSDALTFARSSLGDAVIVEAELSVDAEDIAEGEPAVWEFAAVDAMGAMVEIELDAATGDPVMDEDEGEDEGMEADLDDEALLDAITGGVIDLSTVLTVDEAFAAGVGGVEGGQALEAELELSPSGAATWIVGVYVPATTELWSVELDATTGDILGTIAEDIYAMDMEVEDD